MAAGKKKLKKEDLGVKIKKGKAQNKFEFG